jgi:hypothetical protein
MTMPPCRARSTPEHAGRMIREMCTAVMTQMDHARARRWHVEMLASLIRLRDASTHRTLYAMREIRIHLHVCRAPG